MAPIVFIAGIAAAACNAGSSVLQRSAASRPNAGALFSRQFAVAVTKQPLFLAGFGLQALAAAMQAVALGYGPISLVQPLLTTDLVFLLVFLRFKTGIPAGWQEWLGVGAIIAGLAGLFGAARPRGGSTQYELLPWVVTIAAAGLVVAICMAAAWHITSSKRKVATISLALACTYALNAAFTKLALHQLRTGGIGQLLSSWPMYAIVISGILSLYLMQNVYGAGPLAVSQPVVEACVPAMGVVIGITIFGETVRHSGLALAVEAVCAAILLAGIIALGSSRKISPGYTAEAS